MYLTEQQLDRQFKALESLAKQHSAKTDFVFLPGNEDSIMAYWKIVEPKKQIQIKDNTKKLILI